MIAVLAIVLFAIATIGGAEEKTKGCPSKAVSFAKYFLETHNRSYSSVECFQEIVGCVGFDVQTPLKWCAKELNLPKLTDPEWTVNFLKNYTNDKDNVLQATCCVKTKEALVNLKTFAYLRKKIDECAAKLTCQQSAK